jgi:hypothetical protein
MSSEMFHVPCRRALALSMAISKQSFYEGAALHLLARTGAVRSIRYAAPFYLFNKSLFVLIKYSTRNRSPWGFTFTADEQVILQNKASEHKIVLGLVCGGDGVAALGYEAYLRVAWPRKSAIHISCYRQHGEHYELNGPDGTLHGKIPPSMWRHILEH